MVQANTKFDEYRARLAKERHAAKQDYEAVLTEAKKEEAKILSQARDEAKKITQEAADSILKQRALLKAQLEADIEGMAQSVSDKLLSRKV